MMSTADADSGGGTRLYGLCTGHSGRGQCWGGVRCRVVVAAAATTVAVAAARHGSSSMYSSNSTVAARARLTTTTTTTTTTTVTAAAADAAAHSNPVDRPATDNSDIHYARRKRIGKVLFFPPIRPATPTPQAHPVHYVLLPPTSPLYYHTLATHSLTRTIFFFNRPPPNHSTSVTSESKL